MSNTTASLPALIEVSCIRQVLVLSSGLGRGFVETFLAMSNTTVISAVRDTSSSSSQSLKDIPTGPGSVIHRVKLDCAIREDATAAVEQVKSWVSHKST